MFVSWKHVDFLFVASLLFNFSLWKRYVLAVVGSKRSERRMHLRGEESPETIQREMNLFGQAMPEARRC